MIGEFRVHAEHTPHCITLGQGGKYTDVIIKEGDVHDHEFKVIYHVA